MLLLLLLLLLLLFPPELLLLYRLLPHLPVPEAVHLLLDTLLLLPPHLLHMLHRHLRMLRRAREESLGRERPFALESHIPLLRLLLPLLLQQL